MLRARQRRSDPLRPETLDFPPLHCSLDAELGDYYLDKTAAIEMVAAGYHGTVDDAGIPLVDYGELGLVHNAITVAQYALALMTAIRRGERQLVDIARAQLDWLVAAQPVDGPLEGCWPMEFDNPKYPWLRAPWVSAMASGNAISALLRGFEMFGDARYQHAAGRAYTGLHAPRMEGVLVVRDGPDLWYEEYPSQPPSHVLNGHVYSLLGVADFARHFEDEEAHAHWRGAATTVLRHLDDFDLGYWSTYDLRWREPVTLHYQKNIHVPQLRVLAALTGEPRFEAVAARWEHHAHRPLSRARFEIAVRVHARFRESPHAAARKARTG